MTTEIIFHKCESINFFFICNPLFESDDRLAEILKLSREVCKKKYNTDIYCVVSNNAKNMLKMSMTLSSNSNLKMWSNTYSSYIRNLLAKDVVDDDVNTEVMAILKKFKQLNNEKFLTEAKGSRLTLSCHTILVGIVIVMLTCVY